MATSAASLMVVSEGQAEGSKESATPFRGVNATEVAPASSLMRVRILVVLTVVAILCPPSPVEFATPFREVNATEVPLVASLTMRTLLLALTPTTRPESRGSVVILLPVTVNVGRVAGILTTRSLVAMSGRKGNGPEVLDLPCALGPRDPQASATPSRGGSVIAGPAADSRMKGVAPQAPVVPQAPGVFATLFREANATAESLADSLMSKRNKLNDWPHHPMNLRA